MLKRLGTTLAAASALVWLGCGGGGGGDASGGPSAAGIDADTTYSPAVDASYYNIPSTPLGAIVSGGTVTFSHWSPTASSVTLNLYAHWNDSLSSPATTVNLTKGAGGVWSSGAIALPAQAYYGFSTSGGYMLDPYAKSMAQWVGPRSGGIPGDSYGKGAILDPSATGPDGGWSDYSAGSAYFDGSAMVGPDGATAAPYTYAAGRDAIIYEAGIRDLTVDPFLTGFAAGHPWGTYKGLVDLLPHIQKLGVTHVQLLCPLENYYYDQTKVGQRELTLSLTSGANYNWGYDPQNYFTPSGMYSAAPSDPAARVNELKTLINEIHKRGMGVILDVVYNHTANDNVLGTGTDNGYFYRTSSSNGAGSHDVASERKMTRKLIVDSVNYWVGSYRVDGFRFDLMGDLDTGTIIDAYKAATKLNPHALFVGEGWNGFYSGPATDYNGQAVTGSDQTHAAAFAGMNIALFSDSYRQIFKNGYPTEGQTAFITGAAETAADLFANAKGSPTNFTAPATSNVVNYLTCHDGLTYYDTIAMATNTAKGADSTVLQRAKLGYAVLFTSQGVAFIQAGDEMFRTKETVPGAANAISAGTRWFVSNSYNASDAVNMVGWARVYKDSPLAQGFQDYDATQAGYSLYAYTQGLIALRKSSNAFRLPDAAIAGSLSAISATGAGTTTLAFGYRAASTDGTGTWYVFHNADSVAHSFTADVSLAGATLLADGNSAGTAAITGSTTVAVAGATATLQPRTSAIFRVGP